MVFKDAIPRIIKSCGTCLDDNNQVGQRQEKVNIHIQNSARSSKQKRLLEHHDYGFHEFHPDATKGIKVKKERSKATYNKEKLDQLKVSEDRVEVLGEAYACNNMNVDDYDDKKRIVKKGI